MDINVSPFKTIGLSRKFSWVEKIVLLLFIIAPLTCYIANYSAYYIPNLNVYSSVFAVFLFVFIGQSLINHFYKKYAVFYIFLVGFTWLSTLIFHSEMPSVKLIYELLFAGCFISMCADGKIWVYDKFIKILAIILLCGIIEYFLARLGVSFFWGEAIRPNSTNINTYYQGLFNIFPHYYSTSSFRFQSIAEEPGLVGTLCFFIISTINVQRYKFQTIIFCVAGLLTMSLAFYVLIGLWSLFSFKVNKYQYILLAIFVVGILYYHIQDSINEFIIARFLEASQDGTLDNRNSEVVSSLFNATFESFETFVCGIGNRTFEAMDTGNSAGIKKYIVQYGFIMIMIAVYAFCYIYVKLNGNNKATLLVLFLFLLSLYQRFDLNLGTNIIVLFSAFIINKLIIRTK